jgi:hypothetical protein
VARLAILDFLWIVARLNGMGSLAIMNIFMECSLRVHL